MNMKKDFKWKFKCKNCKKEIMYSQLIQKKEGVACPKCEFILETYEEGERKIKEVANKRLSRLSPEERKKLKKNMEKADKKQGYIKF